MAVVQPRCLYCGAPLPDAVRQAAEASRGERERLEVLSPAPAAASPVAGDPPSAPPNGRALLVLDTTGLEAATLSIALSLSTYDAAQRLRRGGHQLLRIAARAVAEEEATRLLACGVAVQVIAEEDVQKARVPVLVRGGSLGDGTMRLFTPDGALALAPGDVLLAVKGPIARELQAEAVPGGLAGVRAMRRSRTSALLPGARLHLHRRQDPRPLEIDPEIFSFDDQKDPGSSSALRLAGWLAKIAADTPVDDGFRFLPPALAPAEAAAVAPSPADALRGHDAAGQGKRAPILDNLGQFRGHSAWLGTLFRERLRG